MTIDLVELSKDLIRCPSITPNEAGAIGILEEKLLSMGFNCRRLPFAEEGMPSVENLYARIGSESPHFCFAGHTDVVPPGDNKDWISPPFEPEVREKFLFGRGAADMKCAIAAMVSAAEMFLKSENKKLQGSISFLITGDEEGPAINGTSKVLE
ncbi:MAG: Succinyl-diaminopimelate desuccinylase, partial [Alphaproteobacteria bacterium MarineAlpha3_Bin5]